MTRIRTLSLALLLVVLLPSVADAHSITTGLGPFYDGVTHLALSPEDWLGLVAIALLAGLGGAKTSRWTLLVLPSCWLLGALPGLYIGQIPELSGLSILSVMVVGLLVALDVKLPAWGVATLAGAFGLLHGSFNGTALAEANRGWLDLLGIVVAAFVMSLLVSALVVSLQPAWARMAVRVAGSWVVAVGMLMFGWLLRDTV